MSEDNVVKALREAHPLPNRQRRRRVGLVRAIARICAVMILSYSIVGVGTLAWGFVANSALPDCGTDRVDCQTDVIDMASQVVADAAVWPRFWSAEMRARFEAPTVSAPMVDRAPLWTAGTAPH